MLTDRWPDVRWISLCICTSLADSEQGRRELEKVGQKFVGGLWSFVFTILLDDMECGFVRQQVSLIVVYQWLSCEAILILLRTFAFLCLPIFSTHRG